MNSNRMLIGVTLMVVIPSWFAYAANSVITIHGTGDPSTSAHITVTANAYLCPRGDPAGEFIVETGASLSIWGRDAIGGITSGRGTVALVDKSGSADNRTFNYEVTWESGWIASCTYYGSNITDASVDGDAAANGWGVQTQTPTTVVFTTDTELTSGSLTGFHITGLDVAAPGSWECGSGSGNVDGPLPVELSSFTGAAGDRQATLRWVTESEIDNLGFHIYRALSEDGEYKRLTSEVIESVGNTSTQQTYSFTDIRLTNGVTYWYKLEDVARDGTSTMHGPISVALPAEEPVEIQALPTEFGLSQNSPNPFNPRTTIRYQLPEASEVRLTVYNTGGQLVQVLLDAHKEAGYYTATYDARRLGSGIYLYRLEAGTFIRTRKMVKME